MRITQLHADTAYTATSEWAADHPPRFETAFSTVATDNTAIYLGIFSDSHLLSVITLQPRARGIYEVHLALKRGVGVEELLPAFFSIRQQLFSQLNVKELSGWVPRLHWGIRKVASAVGFEESGATMLQMVGNRLIEWQQLVLKTG